jgi:hypothetical protein
LPTRLIQADLQKIIPAQVGYWERQGEIIYEIDIDGKREWLAQTATVKIENLSAGHISYSEIGFPYSPDVLTGAVRQSRLCVCLI